MNQLRVPGHPYASYATGYDGIGQFWIFFGCSSCGAQHRRQCSDPKRVDGHVFRWAVTHSHGAVRPVTR